MNLLTLTDRHVYRRIGRVHPAFRNQPQRASLRRVVAEIDFDVMIARHTLIPPASKVIEVFLVKSDDNFRHVVATVIYCVRYLVRRLDGSDCQLRRWYDKTFIDDDFYSRWLVCGH